MIECIETIQSLRERRQQLQGTVGFVPTMGHLHAGHLKLIEQACTEQDHVIVSLFVNPTQFNDTKDFEKYPRTIKTDLALLSELPVTLCFMPSESTMYPKQRHFSITETTHQQIACGKTRPGHFTGVLTIVLKLLNITQATHLYLGEKDYQQLNLIQDMIQAFMLPVQVIAVPTVREANGLAMSSRNSLLSVEGHQYAANFYKIIKQNKSIDNIIAELTAAGFQVDYVEPFKDRLLAAVYYEGVRLIDNIQLELSSC